MADIDNFGISWQGLTHGQVEDAIKAKVAQMIAGSVTQSDVNAAVSAAINALVNGAPAALDTLKELADALSDSEDAVAALTTALAGKLGPDSDIILQLQAAAVLASSAYQKPNTGIPKSDLSQSVQDAIDNAGSGSVESVTINGTKHTPDANGDVDLGTIQKGEKGDTGNVEFEDLEDLVALLVNDLTTGGAGNFLSAEMGLRLKAKIEEVYGKMRTMYSLLAGIAFTDTKPNASLLLPDLYWGSPKHTVTLSFNLTHASVKLNGAVVNSGSTLQVEEFATVELSVEADQGYGLSSVTSQVGTVVGNTVSLVMGKTDITLDITAVAESVPSVILEDTYLELSGSLSGSTYSGTLAVKSAYASTKGLPFSEDVTAMMGGTSKAITYDDTTGAITINDITANVEITATATEIEGVDNDNNPVRWKNGLYFSGEDDDTTTEDANWCISDYLPCDGMMAKTLYDAGGLYGQHFICIYDGNKEFLGHISFGTARYMVLDLANYADYKFIRICYPIAMRASRYVYGVTADEYIYKGSGYDGRYEDAGIWANYDKNLTQGSGNSPVVGSETGFAYTDLLAAVITQGNSVEFDMGSIAQSGLYNKAYAEFYGSTSLSSYIAHIGQSTGRPRSWTAGSTVIGTNYIRMTVYLAELDNCYFKNNSTYIFKGLNIT